MPTDASAHLLILPKLVNLPHTDSCIAYANFTVAHAWQDKKSQQSTAVRQLLTWVLDKQQSSAALVETSFPYVLQDSAENSQKKRFVCFSHSKNQVALIISSHPTATDIELRPIPKQVIIRFFHINERIILESLNEESARRLARLLWQLKECWIKLHQQTLAIGMGTDFSYLCQKLLNLQATDSLSFYHQSDLYQIYLTTDKLLSLVQLQKTQS